MLTVRKLSSKRKSFKTSLLKFLTSLENKLNFEKKSLGKPRFFEK